MSCFFCNCNYHVSHCCDKYLSNEERQEIISTKNCCSNCLNPAEIDLKCPKCGPKKNCYICFSENHPTVFCPRRLTTRKMPNIDLELLPRFMKLLNKQQKHLMAITYPSILESLQPLKILYKNKMCFSDFRAFKGLDIAVIDHATVVKMNLFQTLIFGLLPLKLPDFHIRHLEIHQTPVSSDDLDFHIQHVEIHQNPFLSDILLKLLSSRTQTFICPERIEFNPGLTLVEILKKAPYLDEIDIKYTNIQNGNTCPNDIIKYSKVKRLKKLHLSISGLEFDIDDLAVFMKKEFSEYLKIHLNVFHHFIAPFSKEKIVEDARTHFSKHFIVSSKYKYNPWIRISFVDRGLLFDNIDLENFKV